MFFLVKYSYTFVYITLVNKDEYMANSNCGERIKLDFVDLDSRIDEGVGL